MVHSTGLKSSIGLVKIGRPDLKTRISDRWRLQHATPKKEINKAPQL